MRFHRHEDIVLTWRRHAMNMTNNVSLDRDYLATAIRRALQRRRGVISQAITAASFECPKGSWSPDSAVAEEHRGEWDE